MTANRARYTTYKTKLECLTAVALSPDIYNNAIERSHRLCVAKRLPPARIEFVYAVVRSHSSRFLGLVLDAQIYQSEHVAEPQRDVLTTGR